MAYGTLQQPPNADVPHDQSISPHPRAFGEPGARLVESGTVDANTRCCLAYRVRNRSRHHSAPKVFPGPQASFQKQASQSTKRPAHRGMRAAHAETTRRRARHVKRREARRAKRRPAHILRPLELRVASQRANSKFAVVPKRKTNASSQPKTRRQNSLRFFSRHPSRSFTSTSNPCSSQVGSQS